MNIIAWVALFAFASCASYVTLTRTEDDQLLLITGFIAFFAWALFAFSALGVTESSSGVTTTFRYPEMTAFGLMMAAPNLYVALSGPLNIIKDREQLRGEVS